MNRTKDKPNKSELIRMANSLLDEEFSPLKPNLSTDQNREIDYDNREIKPEKRDVEIRDRGYWESELSETAPLKEGIIRRVSRFKKLPNSGLTPYEMMYGKQDDDYDILGKSLE